MSFNVQFYCRKSKATKNGTAPLEMAVNINGERKFISLPYKCHPEEFNRKKQPIELVDYQSAMRKRVNEILANMVNANEPLTTRALTEYIKNGGFKSYTVENLFEEYIDILNHRRGKTITQGVYEKYVLVKNLFYTVIPKEYECTAIAPAHVQRFKALCENRYMPSTTAGYLQKLKTFLTYGMDNGKIKINPFLGTKIIRGTNDITYLTEGELRRLEGLQIENKSLNNILKIFLFECYSGISYCDIMNLDPNDIKVDNGVLYIIGNRKKTGKEFTSVLFPNVKNLIVFKDIFGNILNWKNWEEFCELIGNQEVMKFFGFKKIALQKVNAYLHAIESIYNFDKKLTTHLGRHTYATLLANKYKCRMELVASALGDSLKITTKHYAKFLSETTVSEIGEKLRLAE